MRTPIFSSAIWLILCLFGEKIGRQNAKISGFRLRIHFLFLTLHVELHSAYLMESKSEFQIDLLDANLEGSVRAYTLDDAWFAAIDGLIQHGAVQTEVRCTRASAVGYDFTIHSEGTVVAACDRCLADIELRIDTTDRLTVRLGDDYADDGDVLTVPEQEGLLDVAQPIYEFIALSMPLQLVHEPGMCDESMVRTIAQYQPARSSEADGETDGPDSSETPRDAADTPVDARWNALKDLVNDKLK